MQKYKSRNKTNTSLSTNTFFVDIVDESTESYVLEIKFSLKKTDIIQKSLEKVVVKAVNQDLATPSSTQGLQGMQPGVPAGIDGTVSTSNSPNISANSTRRTVPLYSNVTGLQGGPPTAGVSPVAGASPVWTSNSNSAINSAAISGIAGGIVPVHNPTPTMNTMSAQTGEGTYGPKRTITKLSTAYTNLSKIMSSISTVIDTTEVTGLEYYIDAPTRASLKSVYEQVGKVIDVTSIASMYESVDSLESKFLDDNDRLTNRIEDPTVTVEEVKNINLQLLIDEKVDPSEAVTASPVLFPTYELLDRNLGNYSSLTKKLKKYYLKDSIKSFNSKKNPIYKIAKKNIFNDKVSISSTINIPKSLKLPDFDVVFEVFRSGNNSPVDTKTRSVKYKTLIDAFTREKEKPTIKRFTGKSMIDLEAKRPMSSVRSDSVVVKAKRMGSRGNFTSYATVTEKVIDIDKPASAKSAVPPGNISIFRAYLQDTRTNKLNSNYRTVIVGDVEYDPAVLVVTNVRNTRNFEEKVTRGITFEVKNLPQNIRGQTITGWNVRWKNVRGGYDYLTGDISSWIDLSFNETGASYSWDPNGTLMPNNSYEFQLMYRSSLGNIKYSYTNEYTWIRSAFEDNVSTKINDSVFYIGADGPIMSFRINTLIPPAGISKLLNAFKSSNVYDEFTQFFDNDSMSDLYTKIVQHQVNRVNLDTGERVVFGDLGLDTANIPTGDILFSDSPSVRKRLKIDFDPGASYMYEVRVSLSDPVALLPDFGREQDITLPGGAVKRIRYNPLTWYQPKLMGTGIVPALDERNRPILKYKDDFFEPGEIGITAVYSISGKSSLEFKVNSLNATRIDINTVKVSWGVKNLENDYDHFVVVKEVNGERRILDAVHTTFVYDDITYEESGTIVYYVTPVFNNYAVGGTSRSNSLFFDVSDFFVTKKNLMLKKSLGALSGI